MERVTAIINSMHYIHVKVEVYMHVKKKKQEKRALGSKKGSIRVVHAWNGGWRLGGCSIIGCGGSDDQKWVKGHVRCWRKRVGRMMRGCGGGGPS